MSEKEEEAFIEWYGKTAAMETFYGIKADTCPHIPRCFEKSDGCWNYDEAKKRVDAYPNFP